MAENFFWGQILPTLCNFYEKKSFYLCKEKQILKNIVKEVLTPNPSNSFISSLGLFVCEIATEIRKNKLKNKEKTNTKIDTSNGLKYLN